MVFVGMVVTVSLTFTFMDVLYCSSKKLHKKQQRQSANFTFNMFNSTTVLQKRTIWISSHYPVTLLQSYKINNPGICRNISKLSAVVIVNTSPDNFERRNLMRKTWLNSTFYYPETIRVVFLLGIVSNLLLQFKIENENSVHKDIVQGHFIDSYHNLTNKGVMGLKWITEHCQNAEFVVKVDDDVFVNFFKVFKEISFIKHKKRYIMCHRMIEGTNPIQRQVEDKWYVAKDEFKLMNHYPFVSCSGLVVFMSSDLIPLMYTAAFMCPFFWIDDIYLFGILPTKINGVVHHEINANISIYKEETDNCFQKSGSQCKLIAGVADPDVINVVRRSWKAVIGNDSSITLP